MYNDPLVSILLPVFNGGEYLSSAIQSMMHQSYENIELIIVNDGSTDSTAKVIEGFLADKRVVFINRSVNRGLVYSLNEGLEKASGKYIARMDSDDISLPKRIETQVKVMEKRANLSVLGSYLRSIDDKAKLGSIWTHPVEESHIKCRLLFESSLFHPTTMFRSEVLKDFQYRSEYESAEDFDLWQRLSFDGHELANIPEVLLKYRVHGSQIGTLSNEKQKEVAKRVRENVLDHLSIKAIPDELHFHNKLANKELSHENDMYLAFQWLNKIYDKNLSSKKLNASFLAYEMTRVFYLNLFKIDCRLHRKLICLIRMPGSFFIRFKYALKLMLRSVLIGIKS